MLLSLLATNDAAIGSTAFYAALKTAKLSVMNGFQCLMSDVQEYFLLTMYSMIHITWQVPGAAVATGPGALRTFKSVDFISINLRKNYLYSQWF